MPLKYYAELQGKPVSVPCPASGVELETFIPWTLVKRGAKKEIITPIDTPEAFIEEAAAERQHKKAEQHAPVIRALGLANYWQSLIDAGKFESIAAIAAAEGLSKGHVNRLAQLCRLSPANIQQYLEGKPAAHGKTFTRREIPLDWYDQT